MGRPDCGLYRLYYWSDIKLIVMYVKGRDLLLYRYVGNQYVPIASCQTCSLQIKNDAVERLPVGEWAWREYLLTKNAWGISASGLIDLTTYGLFDLLNTRVVVVVSYVLRAADNTASVDPSKAYYRKGTAIITSLSEESSYDGKASWNVQLQGTGKLTAI